LRLAVEVQLSMADIFVERKCYAWWTMEDPPHSAVWQWWRPF